jgi:hypothetical protein
VKDETATADGAKADVAANELPTKAILKITECSASNLFQRELDNVRVD